MHDGWVISDERLHCKLLPPWDENEIQYRCSFFNTPSQCVAKISLQVTKFAHNYNCTLLTWVDVFWSRYFHPNYPNREPIGKLFLRDIFETFKAQSFNQYQFQQRGCQE